MGISIMNSEPRQQVICEAKRQGKHASTDARIKLFGKPGVSNSHGDSFREC
jgi:hypothetical protein